MRENVMEPDPSKAQITKLDPAEVMTTAQAAALLAPCVKPLPDFDDYVLGRRAGVTSKHPPEAQLFRRKSGASGDI